MADLIMCIFVSCLVYFFIGFLFGTFTHSFMQSNLNSSAAQDDAVARLVFVFWPIAMPVIAVVFVATCTLVVWRDLKCVVRMLWGKK